MAPLFGVSRSTIREALRILVTDGLVETKRGVRGGTFVVDVDTSHVEGLLNSTLNLLAVTNRVGPDDFLDAWHAIEAPAAALAATRATPADVEQLFHLCEPAADDLSRPERRRQEHQLPLDGAPRITQLAPRGHGPPGRRRCPRPIQPDQPRP